MIRRLLIGAVLAAGTLVPAASASAQTPPPPPQPAGAIGIRLIEAPVSRENDPRAKVYVVDHVAQGTTITRKFEVINGTPTQQPITLYPGSAVLRDGEFRGADGHAGNELTGWTSISPDQLVLAPYQRGQATVTVSVPKTVGDGERYGVVWAEQATAPQGPGVTVLNRVGIRMYLSVGTGSEPTTDFDITTLTTERDTKTHQPLVRAHVVNTGGRAIDMSGTLELRDGPGGLSAGPFRADLGTTLAPKQEADVRVRLDPRIPNGPWDGVITLRSGEIEHTKHGRILFVPGGTRSAKASSLGRSLKILLPLAGILVALIVGIVLAVRRRRDKYAEIKRDLRQFEKLVKAQAAGGTPVPSGRDDPAIAIRAAITQAGRAGDKETAAKLQAKLDELLAIRAASAPEVDGDSEPAPSGALGAILQELATAPEARRDALVRAARAYGQPELQQHSAVIDQLPEDIRMKLFRPTQARKPKAKPSAVKPPSSKTRP